jgi:hypothetical protein
MTGQARQQEGLAGRMAMQCSQEEKVMRRRARIRPVTIGKKRTKHRVEASCPCPANTMRCDAMRCDGPLGSCLTAAVQGEAHCIASALVRASGVREILRSSRLLSASQNPGASRRANTPNPFLSHVSQQNKNRPPRHLVEPACMPAGLTAALRTHPAVRPLDANARYCFPGWVGQERTYGRTHAQERGSVGRCSICPSASRDALGCLERGTVIQGRE